MLLQITFESIPQWLSVVIAGAIATGSVYVTLRENVGLLKQQVGQLEKRLEIAESRLNDHDDDIHKMILKVQEDLTEIKLMIAKSHDK